MLLVQKSTAPAPAKDEIKSAVLIDGGYGEKSVSRLINTMVDIENTFAGLDPTTNKLKFDAVSISHWDMDHYYGFCVRPYGFLSDPRIGWDAKTQQCNAFKYDNSTPRKPLTRFYAQEWAVNNDSNLRMNKKNPTMLDLQVKIPAGTDWVWYDNALLFTAGTPLLGVNLFSGFTPTSAASNSETLDTLISTNDPWRDTAIKGDRINAPGLYAVGVDRQLWGGPISVVPGPATSSNAGSILLLLVWKPIASTDPIRVSFYSGGDAEWEQEDALAAWLVNPATKTPYTIKAVKAGHHGSRSGTSINFIQKVKPDHYLVSSGTKHGHPVPEVVWYLDAWFSSAAGSLGLTSPSTRIHGVCFPYYLGLVAPLTPGGSPDYVNARYFNDSYVYADAFAKGIRTKPAWINYLDEVQKLYPVTDVQNKVDPIGRATTAYADLGSIPKTPPKDVKHARVQWVASELRTMWEKWAEPNYGFYPVSYDPDAEYIAKVNALVKDVMQYMKVTFSYTAADDAVFLPKAVLFEGLSLKSPGSTPSKKKKRKRKKFSLLADGEPKLNVTLRSGRIVTANWFESVFPETYEARVLALETVGDPDFPDPLENEDSSEIPPSASKASSVILSTGAVGGFPSSKFESILPAGSDSSQLVLSTGNMNDFVTSLHDSSLTLALPVNVPVDPVQPATLAVNDDLQTWWNSVFTVSGATASMQVIFSTAEPYVDSFQLELTEFTPSASWTLAYSSAPSALGTAFDVDSSSGSPMMRLIDPQGLFNAASPGLLLGFQGSKSVTNTNVTLSDLFITIELDFPNWLSLVLSPSTSMALDQDPGSVNGIWFYPGPNYATTFRIQTRAAEPDSNVALSLLTFLATLLPDCNCSAVRVLATKTSTYSRESEPGDTQNASEYTCSSGDVCLMTTIQFKGSSSSWDIFLTIEETSVSALLQLQDVGSGSALQDFLKWIGDRTGTQGVFDPFSRILQNASSTSELSLRQVSLSVDTSSADYKFTSFSIEFEADLDWGVPSDESADKRVPVGLVFSWIASAPGQPLRVNFQGQMFPQVTDDMNVQNRLNPDNIPLTLLKPSASNPRYSFSLLGLPSIDQDMMKKVPNSIPTEVSNVSFSLSPASIQFSGVMTPRPPLPGTAPVISLGELSFSVIYNYVDPKSLSVGFSASVYLQPRPPPSSQASAVVATKLSVAINYINGTWSLQGQSNDLSMACLYSLFSSSENEAVMNVMEEINVPSFIINYEFAAGLGSAFSATGTMLLDDVELYLNFNYGSSNNSPSSWTFEADLSETNNSTAIKFGDFLAGIASDLSLQLPTFVKEMSFSISSADTIKLKCYKSATSGNVLFSIVASVGDFEFSFVQISPSPPNPSIPTKRLLKFTMDRLPEIDSVPLLAKLAQPFDQMDFLWVSVDLTQSDVTVLNSEVYTDVHDQLIFKTPPGSVSGTTPVIFAGCHFVVIIEESNVPTAIIDYCFDGQHDPPPQVSALSVSADPGPPSNPSNGGATGVMTKTVGPLTVSAIGLKYQDGDLQISFDAKVQIGPVSGILNGFGVQFPVSKIQKFNLTDLSVLIDGIGLALDQPPVVISGMLVKSADIYKGGIVVEVDPYTFMAGGLYGTVPNPGPAGGTFKTIFIFAQLDGPLVELEFASISGITGGFGYNSAMTLPTVTNVTQFPFLESATFDPNPLQVLNGFLKDPSWFIPTDGPIWFAAGLDISAFQALSIQAVVAVDLTVDVVFAVFADCVAKIPEAASNDAELFALVDMGLLAVVDYAKGIFHVEGQLTPRSFILDRSCHLTGGFAMCYWYEGSGHDGDWVFTIGGYHSAFTPPSHYPVPPRVGISWQYDSNISITGEAFFAVTPKVCMGGGRLNLTYQNGALSAYFNAYADFLINYRPFSFIGEIGVDIGVSYTLHVWFVTHRFNVHFGASLHLHGPPVAGYAHVDWSIIS
ncbi:MAG: hypothetical protein M4579_006668, partial [Chaenotheca gracillima]